MAFEAYPQTAEKKNRVRTCWTLLLVGLLAVGVFLCWSRLHRDAENPEDAPLCRVELPLLAHADGTRLLNTAMEQLRDTSLFPFEVAGSSVIPSNETHHLNKVTPNEDGMECSAATYGSYPIRLMSTAWKSLHTGDVIVDLGAGIGYVAAAAAMLTNATFRGIELSLTRANTACEVLSSLNRALDEGGHAAAKAPGRPMRTVEIWNGDLFMPPPAAVAAPPAGSRFVAFSYANCFSDSFIIRIMKYVGSLPHPGAQLMISKLPKDESKIPEFGLRRTRNSGMNTYERA